MTSTKHKNVDRRDTRKTGAFYPKVPDGRESKANLSYIKKKKKKKVIRDEFSSEGNEAKIALTLAGGNGEAGITASTDPRVRIWSQMTNRHCMTHKVYHGLQDT